MTGRCVEEMDSDELPDIDPCENERCITRENTVSLPTRSDISLSISLDCEPRNTTDVQLFSMVSAALSP